jgi:hypothetical protein
MEGMLFNVIFHVLFWGCFEKWNVYLLQVFFYKIISERIMGKIRAGVYI